MSLKKEFSLMGKILYNIEKKLCNNFKTFIGKHEKTGIKSFKR